MLALYWDIKTIWFVTIFLSVLLVFLERRMRKKSEKNKRQDRLNDRLL